MLGRMFELIIWTALVSYVKEECLGDCERESNEKKWASKSHTEQSRAEIVGGEGD